jgi:hypothetical protein
MEETQKHFLKSQEQENHIYFSLLFNIVLELLARAIRQEKKIQVIQIEKETVKLYLFAADIIVYLNIFRKARGYRIHKSVAFLHTSNELTEREVRQTIPFTISS